MADVRDVAATPAEAKAIAEKIGGPVVVKSQVLVGGRGKAGGIKLAKTPAEAEEVAGRILGMDIKGLTVKKVLVDPAAQIANEIYLGMILDRATRRVVVMASAAGGMDIEEVAATTPEKIVTVAVDPCLGLREYQARDIALKMDLPREQLAQFTKICQGLYTCYMDIDASLAEINPLAALGDDAHLDWVKAQTLRARARLTAIAKANGLSALPSATNFVTIDCGRDGDFARAVLRETVARGVFIRMPGVAPLDRCIRVSLGDEAALSVLEEVLPQALAAAG